MTLLEYLESLYVRDKFLKQTTLYSYRHACGEVSIPVEALSRDHVGDHARRLLSAGMSPHTVKGRVGIICCVWRHAKANGMAGECIRPSLPKCPRKIVTAISPDTLRKVIEHAEHMAGQIKGTGIPRSVYWPAFIAATYETALRTSDVRQLRWEPSGRWHLVQVKTSRPVTVDVGHGTLALLERLSRVSPTLLEMGWRREWYCRGLARIAGSIGLHVTPQQLRQSAASEAERLKPGTAWILLGHSSPATCQTWYIDSQHAYADLPRPRIQWP